MKKRGSLFFAIVLVMALGLASLASGKEVKRSITINLDAKMGGQVLEKGTYTVKYIEGEDGELVFLKGSREVVKLSYKTTKLGKSASENAVILKANSDGSYSIKRIEIKGTDIAISFE
ncbi:MAG: hypothetical protein AB1631_02940 [Acidobacteriota bacterium]